MARTNTPLLSFPCLSVSRDENRALTVRQKSSLDYLPSQAGLSDRPAIGFWDCVGRYQETLFPPQLGGSCTPPHYSPLLTSKQSPDFIWGDKVPEQTTTFLSLLCRLEEILRQKQKSLDETFGGLSKGADSCRRMVPVCVWVPRSTA